MSLMSKLLAATLIASVSLSAATPSDKELMKYVKRNIIKNRSVDIQAIKIIDKQEIPELKGWEILLTNISIKFQGKEAEVPETMFVNGNIITPVLMNVKTGKNYRDTIRPDIKDDKFYDDKHLLMGDKSAKHKILVFSDPMCPFCQEVMPDIFKAVKENPKTFALYYYHMPLLRLHPVSDTLTKAMHVAQNKGKADLVEKFYKMKIEFKETDINKIIPEIKKQTGFVVSKEEINAKEVSEALEKDKKMGAELMVSGTPTIYLDSKWDKMRDGYKKFLP